MPTIRQHVPTHREHTHRDPTHREHTQRDPTQRDHNWRVQHLPGLIVWGAVVLHGLAGLPAVASELLVSDRLTNRVLRYDSEGAFLGVLVDDPVNLAEPNGMALSHDGTALFVASRQNHRVVRYDYDGTTAINPTVVIGSGLSVPASLLLSEDGSTLYVSNLGAAFDGATVGQFHLDGTSAGADLTGGQPFGRAGLAWAPDGALLTSSLQDGSVLRLDSDTQQFTGFIGPDPSLQGAGNLLVHGNDLYVAAGFAGGVAKFDAVSGAADPNYTPITGLAFPASLAVAPDGSGILVGILGFVDGAGQIASYGFDGTALGTFALNSDADPSQGFREPTGLLVVPGTEVNADLNGDGAVDAADAGLMFGNWGGSGLGDLNRDRLVDAADAGQMFARWTGDSSTSVLPEPHLSCWLLLAIAVRRRSRT